jgi:hypothetical protein
MTYSKKRMAHPQQHPIEKVSGFRTSDGEVYDSLDDAEEQQKKLDFEIWMHETFSYIDTDAVSAIVSGIQQYWEYKPKE